MLSAKLSLVGLPSSSFLHPLTIVCYEGHQNLWTNNILLRDILLGQKDAEIGNRGIVIDLDIVKLPLQI